MKIVISMPKELQQAVRASQGKPVRLADPETNVEYVVLSAEVYKQMQGLFYTDNPIKKDEQRNLLIKAGLRAGWDDPEMDIYNDLDPRSKSCLADEETLYLWVMGYSFFSKPLIGSCLTRIRVCSNTTILPFSKSF